PRGAGGRVVTLPPLQAEVQNEVHPMFAGPPRGPLARPEERQQVVGARHADAVVGGNLGAGQQPWGDADDCLEGLEDRLAVRGAGNAGCPRREVADGVAERVLRVQGLPVGVLALQRPALAARKVEAPLAVDLAYDRGGEGLEFDVADAARTD